MSKSRESTPRTPKETTPRGKVTPRQAQGLSQLKEAISLLEQLEPKTKLSSDKATYVAVSKQIKEAADLQDLTTILLSLLKRKLYPNHYIVSQLLTALNKHQFNKSLAIPMHFIKCIYKDSVTKKVANICVHNIMIDISGKNHYFLYAKEAYETAATDANVCTTTSIIDAANINNKFDYARDVYAKITNDFDSTQLNLDKVGLSTHCAMLNVAGKSKKPDEAIKIYQYALHPAYIQHYKDQDNVVCAATPLHINVIDALGINEHIDAAWQCYLTMILPDNYVATVAIHTVMLKMAGMNQRIDLAWQAYENALNLNMIDVGLHDAMISAAGANNRLDLAWIAYKNAIAMYPNKDEIKICTYNNMLDALLQNKQIKEAEVLFNESGIKPAIKDTKNNCLVDFHELSFASTYFALKQFVTKYINNEDPLKFQLIYGKGLHSQHIIDNEHPVKKAVKQVIEEMRQHYDITLEQREDNSGVAYCNVSRKLIPEPSILTTTTNTTTTTTNTTTNTTTTSTLPSTYQSQQFFAQASNTNATVSTKKPKPDLKLDLSKIKNNNPF